MSTGGYKYMSYPDPAAATNPTDATTSAGATTPADTTADDDAISPAADAEDVWNKIYPVEPEYNWGQPLYTHDEVLCEGYSPVRVEYVPEAACYITPTRLVIQSPPKTPAKRIRKPVKRYGFE
jgi:hypothetical protein